MFGKRDDVTYRRWAWVHLTDRRLLIILCLVVSVLSYFTYTTTKQQEQLNYVCNQLDLSHERVNRVLDRLAVAAATAPGRPVDQRQANSEFFDNLHLADLDCPPS